MRLHIHLLLGLLCLVATGGVLAEAPADKIAPAPDLPAIQPLAPGLAGTETRLLPNNVDIWAGDWAPNGKSMVYSGKMQGEESTKMRIWYWALDPIANPVPLTNTDQLIDYSPRWSPDGSKLVLVRRSLGKPANGAVVSALWLKDVPEGGGRQLTNGPEDRDPSWSPDGAQIVFSRSQGPYRAQLWIANVADGTCRVLAGTENELLNTPVWGKDGQIYYTKMTPAPKTVTFNNQSYQVMDFGKGSIWSINPNDKLAQPVQVDECDNRLPAVSPDGRWLAFVSSRSTTKEGNGKFDRGSLFLKNLNTGAVYYVTNKVGLVGGSVSWTPDGRKIGFFTYRSIRPAVWVITLPTALPTK